MASAVETAIRSVVTKGVMAVANLNRARGNANEEHAFLTGIHTPMREELSLTDLKVTGTIPAELSGRYVRIGPNPFKPDPRGHHWFVGDGMVHGVRLQGGKALWYHNRYIRSRVLEAEGGPTAAPGPRRSPRDGVNTNVIKIAGKIHAIVEAGSYPAQLDDNLDTVAYTDFGGTLSAPFSAHPHEDPLTGEFHAITYDGQTPDKVWHVVLSPEGKVTRELPIPVQHGPSIHECTITRNYVVVFDLPVTFSMKALISGEKFPYAWNRDHQARVGLLPKQGSADDIVWCNVDPCYVFHVANSYEDEQGRVIVDSAVYETMFEGGADGPAGRSLGMERWTIDPAARQVARQTIDPTPQEFPRPDERFFGQPYRFAWAMGLPDNDDPAFLGEQPLYRHDLATGGRTQHDFGPGRVPGEFVFVPRSADAPEGEGWLMGYVIDTRNETTDLVILDASNMAAPPVASVHIPHRIPPGFHGNWLAD
ncbi:carotenoid oxygenase family protein [Novosphingobium sp.]|jgi:carotenoid cleavage dioxygenase|uniref:8'-apo-carotenoid 13,14-cleaving dioxygenase n=1 Tax=Novosphingobium sp. TaxID=1874826 RepID=UPI0022CC5239|nr:carotenoid oxygenase family protein [Novosphingobium sp.]MCZ8019721.1 carotenoid oxygenase family protein [Novosphingobium sp.]MCZ8035536.1 carotenoid oxygenase family protein [Novosphingobium sp.]MCZ8050850.1 carotenoid oxygenase family protein [Novosphingobium sp.]MCZ8059196.1 carotenoid oxygenase family protein [Novosphingobium sp.]MCZ8232642.1 carotenoid oxygenase family protein [Novosphingobium sp.]